VETVVQAAVNLNCFTDQKYSELLGSAVKCVIAKVADGLVGAKLVQLARLMAPVMHAINLKIDMDEIENNVLEKTEKIDEMLCEVSMRAKEFDLDWSSTKAKEAIAKTAHNLVSEVSEIVRKSVV
jgi:hypothetical protein